MPQFPSNPYENQVFYDPDTNTTYEFWIPAKDDIFCNKLGIKAKWVVKSYESELVTGLFSKNPKIKSISYNKLINNFGYSEDQISDLMEELRQ